MSKAATVSAGSKSGLATSSGRKSQSQTTRERSGPMGVEGVQDDVVRQEVDEDVGPEDETVVETGVAGQQTRQHGTAPLAGEGEGVDVVGELGALADDPLVGGALAEGGEETDQLGMDGAAVVALHEVLDDQLPVGVDLVADRLADDQGADVVAAELVQLAEAIEQHRLQLVRDWRRVIGQREPDLSFPDGGMDREEAERVSCRALRRGRCWARR